jgi:hypothetical protein
MIIYIDGKNREATEQEASAIELEQTALAEANAKTETDRATAKNLILAKLGLTADEVAALLS